MCAFARIVPGKLAMRYSRFKEQKEYQLDIRAKIKRSYVAKGTSPIKTVLGLAAGSHQIIAKHEGSSPGRQSLSPTCMKPSSSLVPLGSCDLLAQLSCLFIFGLHHNLFSCCLNQQVGEFYVLHIIF